MSRRQRGGVRDQGSRSTGRSSPSAEDIAARLAEGYLRQPAALAQQQGDKQQQQRAGSPQAGGSSSSSAARQAPASSSSSAAARRDIMQSPDQQQRPHLAPSPAPAAAAAAGRGSSTTPTKAVAADGDLEESFGLQAGAIDAGTASLAGLDFVTEGHLSKQQLRVFRLEEKLAREHAFGAPTGPCPDPA
jgi:hypothetical protein